MSRISKILLIIGGINWGLVGLSYFFANVDSNWNILNALLGSKGVQYERVEAIIYILVGVAAVWAAITFRSNNCKNTCCNADACSCGCKDCSGCKSGKCDCGCENGVCNAK